MIVAAADVAFQGFCTLHLAKNLKTKFPKCSVQYFFRAAADAYTVEEFNSCFSALCSLDDQISTYLVEEQRPYWARSLFEGNRYNIKTSNNAESFNGRIKKAREFPVLGLLRFIRELLQEWFATRRALSEKCHTILTPRLEEEMVKRANELLVAPVVKDIAHDKYEVRVEELVYIVDLEARTCTCRKFDLDKFPCAHAYAVTKKTWKNAYFYCSPFYFSASWKQAYAENIYPLPNEGGFEFPEDVLAMKIEAPEVKKKKDDVTDEVLGAVVKKKRGPPPTKRKKGPGESRKPPTCGKSGVSGHTRVSCHKHGDKVGSKRKHR